MRMQCDLTPTCMGLLMHLCNDLSSKSWNSGLNILLMCDTDGASFYTAPDGPHGKR